MHCVTCSFPCHALSPWKQNSRVVLRQGHNGGVGETWKIARALTQTWHNQESYSGAPHGPG